MGYEVLDADGASAGLPRATGTPSDVIALDDLPDPRADAGFASNRPPRHRPPWLARLLTPRPAPDGRRSHPARRTWTLVAASAAIGLVLGTVWSGHHAAQVRQAEARGSVSALANFQDTNRVQTAQGPAADFTVVVYNVGSMPLEIATTPSDARLTYLTPLVSLVSAGKAVAPGKSALVSTRVLLQCELDEPIQLSLPVRSPDGDVHQLPVNTTDTSMTIPSQLCDQVDGVAPLDVSLAGTLANPALRVANTTDQPLTVAWEDHLMLDQIGSGRVVMTTEPTLPMTLLPHQTRRVVLNLVVHGCQRNSSLETFNGVGYVSLNGILADHTTVGAMGVDITALLGAALQRSCG